ncbi:MAG: PorT family protein [Thermoanaerobaculia bacterium]|nr:PorT family protein [Thermoanaerobaculia bacterium]
MKRFILLPQLLLIIFGAHAQTLNFGVKAGPQIANFTHATDAKPALLYHFGGFATLDIMNRLQGQAELVLSMSGANNTEKDYYKQRSMYLNMPLLAKFRAYDRLSVHSGFQLGYLLRAKMKITEGNNEGTYDREDKFNRMEVAFALGAEYLITKKLSAGFRINRGLSKLARGYDKPRQNTVQIFAAYRLFESEF